MQIAAAYEVLADNEKRKLYDQVGTYIHARMRVRVLACMPDPPTECLSEAATANSIQGVCSVIVW